MCSFHLKSVRLEERSPCRHNKPWFLSLILCLGLWPRGSYLRSQNGRHIWIPQVCWCTQSHGGRGKLHIRLCPGCKAFQNIRGHSYTGNWKCIKRTFLAKSSVWLHNCQTKPCHNLHGEFLRKLTDREKSDRQQKIWSVCVNHDFGCCYHWTEWLTSWFGFKYPVTCLIGEDLASSVALWWKGSLVEYIHTLIGHFVSHCDFFAGLFPSKNVLFPLNSVQDVLMGLVQYVFKEVISWQIDFPMIFWNKSVWCTIKNKK